MFVVDKVLTMPGQLSTLKYMIAVNLVKKRVTKDLRQHEIRIGLGHSLRLFEFQFINHNIILQRN